MNKNNDSNLEILLLQVLNAIQWLYAHKGATNHILLI